MAATLGIDASSPKQERYAVMNKIVKPISYLASVFAIVATTFIMPAGAGSVMPAGAGSVMPTGAGSLDPLPHQLQFLNDTLSTAMAKAGLAQRQVTSLDRCLFPQQAGLPGNLSPASLRACLHKPKDVGVVCGHRPDGTGHCACSGQRDCECLANHSFAFCGSYDANLGIGFDCDTGPLEQLCPEGH
jgi:hypothetical protein